MTVFIYPYNAGSESVKNLKVALPARVIKLEGSKFKPSSSKTIINWGSSKLPESYKACRVLNKPEIISLCSNKLTFFKTFGEDTNLIEHTTEPKAVKEALEKGFSVVVRHTLQGHSGEGIEIFTPKDLLEKEIPKAPLYTGYKKKKHEFRLHVLNNKIIDVQRKALRTDTERPEEPNFTVRTHTNGFIFVRDDVATEKEIECAKKCVLDFHQKTGLDFGAYDVLYNSKEHKAYIIEINTAPGLTGTTLENYVTELKTMGL